MSGANCIIEGLPHQVIAQWGDCLELVDLGAGEILSNPGDDSQYVYFPVDCILSLTSGDSTQNSSVTLIGNEGVVGAPLFLGDATNSFGAKVEYGGKAYRLPARIANEVAHQSGKFRIFMLNYMQALVFNALQTATCDGGHAISQRVIKVLLIFEDRLSEGEPLLDCAFIAKILGVSGGRVGQVLAELEARRVIKMENELVSIVNRIDLEKMTCECYRVVKDEFDRLLPVSAQ